MRVGLPVPIKSMEETFSSLSEPLQESFRLEDLIETEEETSSKIKSLDDRAASLLRDLDSIHNAVQNFYSDLRAQNLPFFGFNELHDASKKFDNTLHRSMDLLMKTRKSLNKHMD